VLNNLFGFTDNSSLNFSKKIFVKAANKYNYGILLILYNIIKTIVLPFQRFFINLYSVKLQLNRLPFRTIPKIAKQFLVFVVSADL
jgi:hypothetical protein